MTRFYTSDVHASIISGCITELYTYDIFDMDNAIYQLKYMTYLDSPKYVKNTYTNALKLIALIVETENTLQALNHAYNLVEWINVSIADNELWVSMAISAPTTHYEKTLKALLRVRYILSSLEWYKTEDNVKELHIQQLETREV